MSEQVFYAPVAGETVRGEGAATDGGGDWVNGRWTPGSRARRSSLHDVRLRPSSVQEETPPPAPVEVPQYYAPTYDAPQQAAADFTQEDNMARNNGGDERGRPRMPDPLDYDLYDDGQAAQYHRAVDAYVDSRVSAALTPSRQAQNEAEAKEQYNRAFARYGDDSNFKTVMNEALEMCLADAQRGKPVDIERAYETASESVSRRPGQRTAHLPSKAKTIRGLGQLIEHNHKTGRARPYGRGR